MRSSFMRVLDFAIHQQLSIAASTKIKTLLLFSLILFEWFMPLRVSCCWRQRTWCEWKWAEFSVYRIRAHSITTVYRRTAAKLFCHWLVNARSLRRGHILTSLAALTLSDRRTAIFTTSMSYIHVDVFMLSSWNYFNSFARQWNSAHVLRINYVHVMSKYRPMFRWRWIFFVEKLCPRTGHRNSMRKTERTKMDYAIASFIKILDCAQQISCIDCEWLKCFTALCVRVATNYFEPKRLLNVYLNWKCRLIALCGR